MKTTFFCILLVCLSFVSYAQTQYDMNIIADNDCKSNEKALITVYKQIREENKEDSLFIINLKKAQKIWLAFREAQLEVKFPKGQENEQGSSRSMCYNIYKSYLTVQRIKELKEMVISEEGDICR